MLSSIKKHLLPQILIAITIFLTACSSSSPVSSGGGGSGPISPLTFNLAAPGAYPATSSVSYIYLTLNNTSTSNASGLSFSIPAASNTTGTNNITVANGASNPCYNVSAGKSCTFPVTVAANPNQGSFSVVVTAANADVSSLSKVAGSLKSLVGIKAGQSFDLTSSIGLVNVPANTGAGANGITFLYNTPVTAAANGSTIVPITAVVGSNVGAFNTLNLTTAGGTLLNFSTLSGNSGSGLGNLAPGSVVSFNLIIPAGVTSYSFYAQALENGSPIANGQSTNQNTITLNPATTPTGILSAQPQSFSLTTSKTSQILTYTNIGNGPISSISITPPSPLIAGSSTCNGTLAVNSSCTYSVSFTPTLSGAGSIVASYNNGQTTTSTTARVVYTGVSESGLTITSNNNFTFTGTTAAPSNATQITIQNSGNTSEGNIAFTVPTHFSLGAGSSNSCTLSSNTVTNTLAPNGVCTLTLTYTNNTATASSNANLSANYTYGNSQTATTSVTLTYSTTQSSAALTITPASQSFGSIANNNAESTSHTFTLTNTSSDTAATSVTPTITGTNASLFSQSNNTCGGTINAESSCSITVKFGPTSTAAGSESAVLNVAYTPYLSGATANSTSSLTGTVILPTSANMSASFSGSGFAGGDGESANSTFQIQSGSTGTLNVVYTNNGTGAANNFTTTATNIGLWNRSAHGCNTTTVAVNGTCTDTYTINSGTPGANNFNYTNITASYNDESGSVTNQQIIPATASNSMTYVNVYAPAAIAITTQKLAVSGQVMQAESFNVIATLSGGYNVANQTVSVSLSPAANGVRVSPSQCTLQSNNQPYESCSFMAIPNWNLATPGNYTLSITGSSITPSPASVVFSVLSPSIYLPQTGESAGTNGCGATAGADCVLQTGIAIPNSRFVRGIGLAESCITDTLTNLMWESNPFAVFSSSLSWSNAISGVASLNSGGGYCGYNDWRLPNINELRSLVNYGQQSTAAWLNTQGFSNVQPNYYWSSSVYAQLGSGTYWVVYFVDGSTAGDNGADYVWPVRGGQ
jgi:hypothetical protein